MDTASPQAGECDILCMQLLRSSVPSNSKHCQPFFLLNKGGDATLIDLYQPMQGRNLQVQGERKNILKSPPFHSFFSSFSATAKRPDTQITYPPADLSYSS